MKSILPRQIFMFPGVIMIFFAVPVHKLPVSCDENGEYKKYVLWLTSESLANESALEGLR